MNTPNTPTSADEGASPDSDRATAAEPEISTLRDGIPSASYREGWIDAVKAATEIAIKWRDENRAAAARARKRGRMAEAFGFEPAHFAEQLDGAATECHAIAGAISDLARQMAIANSEAQGRADLLKALQFYANRSTWKVKRVSFGELITSASQDRGHRARAAIAQHKGQSK